MDAAGLEKKMQQLLIVCGKHIFQRIQHDFPAVYFLLLCINYAMYFYAVCFLLLCVNYAFANTFQATPSHLHILHLLYL